MIPFTPFGASLGFVALPKEYFAFLIPCILLYMLLVTSIKKAYGIIMENGYEIERFMAVVFWYNTILWDGSWILDWTVSDHDDCNLDEFCVLDNATKKRK